MTEELKKALIDLWDHGVAKVVIEYDGSGDSGEIHSVDYLNTEDEETEYKNSSVEDALTDLCYNNLLDQVGDWYNNDGGYGIIRITVPSGEYTIESHIRSTSTEDSEYSGHLSEYEEEE